MLIVALNSMKDERNRPNFAVLLRLKTPPDSNEMQRDGSDTHFPVACSSSFYLKERGEERKKETEENALNVISWRTDPFQRA